jgi:molecular chaperone GrpE
VSTESAPRIDALRVETLREENLRLRAEVENVRKRARADALAAVRAAHDRLVLALLPVLDSLDRAEAALGPAGGNGGGDPALADGFRRIGRLLRAALESEGVSAFAPAAGERFDPLRHEAADRRETDAADEGAVLEVLERGYLLAGRLLRPARVAVAVRPPTRSSPASAPEAGRAGEAAHA